MKINPAIVIQSKLFSIFFFVPVKRAIAGTTKHINPNQTICATIMTPIKSSDNVDLNLTLCDGIKFTNNYNIHRIRMQLVCPRCSSRINELMECDNCGTIGCIKCMKKSYGKWVCFRCEVPERTYYYETTSQPEKEDEATNAFAAMFG